MLPKKAEPSKTRIWGISCNKDKVLGKWCRSEKMGKIKIPPNDISLQIVERESRVIVKAAGNL